MRDGGQAWLWGQMLQVVLSKRPDPSPIVRTVCICRLTSAYNFMVLRPSSIPQATRSLCPCSV